MNANAVTRLMCAMFHRGRYVETIRLPMAIIAIVRCSTCRRVISSATEPVEVQARKHGGR